MRRTRSWLTWGPTVLALALACGGGSDNGPSQFGFPPAGGTGGGATGTGPNNPGATPGVTGNNGQGGAGTNGSGTQGANQITSVSPPPEAEVCARDQAIANVSPLDIFIMQDRSLSMDDKTASGETKWVVITKALKAFLSDPASTGLSVGVGFFPQFIVEPAPGVTGTPDLSCDPAKYAVPAVGIGVLPQNTDPIISKFEGLYPLGETPTRVAELGATDYAKAYAKDNPTHRVVVVLATDGNPNVCESTINSVATGADLAVRGTPSIRTYVIGVMAADQPDKIKNLNMMAIGGGTGAAFIVDPMSGTGEQFVRAMTAIRNSNKMVCQFDIPRAPTGEKIDASRAGMVYTPGGGAPANLTWRTGYRDCGDGEGYFFDNNSIPSSIRLCASTCRQIQADPGAKLEWVFACKAPPPPPPPPPETGGTPETGAGGTVELGGSPEPGGEGGHGGEPDTTAICLLDGMSCTDSTECCNGSCYNGICQVPIQ